MFIRHSVPGYRLLFLLFVSVVLIVSDGRFQWTLTLRQMTGYLTEPIAYVAHLPKSLSLYFSKQAADRDALQVQNESLRLNNLLLNRRLQQMASLMAENQRLRALLNSSETVSESVLIAEVIGVDPDPFRHEIVLNRGFHDQVSVGQTVLNEKGLTGQIIKVGPNTSRVLTVTDNRHAVPVRNNRNGVRAIAVGAGLLGKLNLSHVPDTADIQVGDLLVSSGLGGRFPSGYPVAEITYIEHDPGKPFAKVEAKPKSELDKLHHVLVVIQEHRL